MIDRVFNPGRKDKRMKDWFKRFWKEWGLSKEDAGMLLGGLGVFGGIVALYFILSVL